MLRSIAAASLLGICGLLLPAVSAQVPAFDAIMLRNFRCGRAVFLGLAALVPLSMRPMCPPLVLQ